MKPYDRLIGLLGINALYFVLTDSASLSGIKLVPFNYWLVFMLAMAFAMVIGELQNNDSGNLIFRFAIVLSFFAGVIMVFFPSGVTLSIPLLFLLVIAHLSGIEGFLSKNRKDNNWILYTLFLISFSLLTVSGLFELPTILLLIFFIVGEVSFITGLGWLIFKYRSERNLLVSLVAVTIFSIVIASVATKSDVMFLVINLVITRVIGSISMEGIIGGTLLFFLLFTQFTLTFTLFLWKKRWNLLALGLTGLSFTYPPTLLLRNYLFLLITAEKQEVFDH